MNKKMQNTEEIDMLLAKFYAGELSDAELKHLMECFQSMEAVPLRWQADAVLIRALAVQAYCSATQKDAEAMGKSRARRPQGRQKTCLCQTCEVCIFCGGSLGTAAYGGDSNV